jgi:hypothetical protein
MELMRRFHEAIKRNFSKIRAYYVGPEAYELLKRGKRLTINEHAAREFDLTISQSVKSSGANGGSRT